MQPGAASQTLKVRFRRPPGRSATVALLWSAALALCALLIAACARTADLPPTPPGLKGSSAGVASTRPSYPGPWADRIPGRPEPALTFEHLAPKDGLSQSVVGSIAQDRRGFIWLATQDGLNRYDGTRFRVFRHDRDDPLSLSESFVSSVLVDSTGVLWAGTNAGLNRYVPETETFVHYRNDPDDPNSLVADSVVSLEEDSLGNLWIGTTEGVSRLDPSREIFTRFTADPSDPAALADNGVTDLYVDRKDNVWIGTTVGLDRFDPRSGAFDHFTPDPARPGTLVGPIVAAILEDRSGILWVGTNAGLNRYNAQTGRFIHYGHDPEDPHSLSDNTVTFLHQDAAGTLWVGTNGGGLNRFDPARRRFLHSRFDASDPSSLASDGVATLFEDATGVTWVGTFGGGVDRYDPRKARFATIHRSPEPAAEVAPDRVPGLSDDLVWSVLIDGSGSLWAGTATGGLNRADPGTEGFRQYRSSVTDLRTISSDQVYRVYEDRHGVLWVGTDAGLDRYDRLTDDFTRLNLPPVFSVLEARDGSFWLGTAGFGLMRLIRATGDTEVFVHDPADPNSLGADFITASVEDVDGRLWLGTFTAGLNRFDPASQTFESFRSLPDDPTSLPSDLIVSVFLDSRGELWAGTSAGLARFNRADGTFTTYAEDEGLKNEVIYAILEDDRGDLWVSTNGGISRLDPSSGTIQNYDTSDGLGSVEFNQAAAYRADGGEMYFGGIDGITVFHPDEIAADPALPPVVLTAFYLFNEPVPIDAAGPLSRSVTESQAIELDYRDDFLAFDYAALDYRSPEEIEYAYVMEGFDPEWNLVGNRTFASYTGLPPGDYVFRVRAANSDGVWNEEGTALEIAIPPPFWRTTWFSVLVVGLVAGGVAGSVSLRLRMLEGRRRELERLVDVRTEDLRAAMEDLRRATEAAQAANRAKSIFLTNVSHELRTPLNAIIGFSQLMIRSAATGRGAGLASEQQENLRVIRRSGEHLLGLINDVLDLSKIESGRATLHERAFDLTRLLEGLEEMFRLRAEQKRLSFEFDVAPEVPRFVSGDEGKLRQALMNLIGNAVKFTTEGGVVIRVRVEETDTPAGGVVRVSFDVEDSGPGLTAEELETIFIPFVQSTAGIESKEGTGLGLAISQQFIRLMGGDLTATSTPGEGSLFQVVVPLRIATHADVLGDQPMRLVVGLEPGQAETRLLVVDDSEVNRKLLVRLFEPLGLQVREAADGAEAIALWEAWSPHLIWMDMRMPVLDGYQATRRIKSTTRGQATVVIALTASALEEDRALILSEGCDDYLRKPFREADLFDMLTKHLGLRFVYQEVAADALAGGVPDRARVLRELAGMPQTWRDDLRQASLLGYPEQIAALIESARAPAPAAAEWLDRLAQTFDHQAIREVLREAEGAGD